MPKSITPEAAAPDDEGVQPVVEAPAQYDREAALVLFKAFDAAADLETSRPAPADVNESRERLMTLINALPQRAAIEDATAETWLQRTMRMAYDRMELEHGEGGATVANIHAHVFWHIRRASGIGGSEAGTVVKHYRGKRGSFGDANTLVKEKLLIMSPQPSTEEMSRGVRGEPWVQKMYHQYARVKTDDDSLGKLRGFRWDKRPAGIGTPDDIVVPVDYDGHGPVVRVCVDYKAPSAKVMDTYDASGISFDYVCQLHHYEIIARAARIQINERSIQAFDPRSFRIAPFPIELDSALARELSGSIDRIWHENVMMGVIPVAPKPDVLDVKDETLISFAMQAAMLRVLEDDIKARKEDLQSRISAISLNWHDLATGKFELPVGSYSRDRVWDEEKLRGIAIAAGIDPTIFEKPDKKLDSDKAMALLKDLHKALLQEEDVTALLQDFRTDGVPLAAKLDASKLAEALEDRDISTVPAAKVKETLRLTTKKKGPEIEKLTEMRAEVSEMAEAIENTFIVQAENILKGVTKPEDVQLDDADLGLEP